MLKSSLCDYSDAYILVNQTVTDPKSAKEGAAANNRKKFNNQKLCYVYKLHKRNK